MDEDILTFLKELASSAGDDPYQADDWEGANDYGGGNVDDAYEAGRSHAEASIGNSAADLLRTRGLLT